MSERKERFVGEMRLRVQMTFTGLGGVIAVWADCTDTVSFKNVFLNFSLTRKFIVYRDR